MKTTNQKIMKESEAPKMDKRTKAYREWKKNHENASEGLGDDIEKYVTKPLGIKKVVDTVFKKLEKQCGCQERKTKLNQIFRYEKPQCLSEEDFNVLHHAVTTNKQTFNHTEQVKFIDIYMRVFPKSKRPECTSCSFKSEVYSRLIKIYNLYIS